MTCPHCGSAAITVAALVWVRIDQDHELDQAYGNGYEYDDASPAVCRNCGTRGILLNFDPETLDSTPESV